jgi:hypothetical protein
MAPRKKAQKKIAADRPTGWDTTDDHEIARRVARAQKEAFRINKACAGDSIFCEWIVAGEKNRPYQVEIRSLDLNVNSCGCTDFQINGLGTCKHIEAVLLKVGNRRRRKEEPESPNVEIYLDGRNNQVQVIFPTGMRANKRIRQLVAGFFDESGCLRGDPLQSIASLKKQLARETPHVCRQLRISSHLEDRSQQWRQSADQREARRLFERDLKQGRSSLDVVKQPLYPYQQEGMMHLAFTGRALLADEMGLGKTVQAIAGSELLNRLHPLDRDRSWSVLRKCSPSQFHRRHRSSVYLRAF